ncbi:MAG: radical SAM protein [Eubacteriales bacterium]|nr:radical SAM protein [Eubacteriales bacterium]
MGKKLTLLLAPEEYAFFGGGFIQARPLPLAIGVLQGALRAAGHCVTSFDLSPILERESDSEKWLFLYDVNGVLESLRHGGDGPLSSQLDALLDATDVETCDAAGVSIGANCSIFEMHTGLLLAARIISRYGKRVAVGGANADHLMQFSGMYHTLLKAVTELGVTLLVGPGDESLPAFLEGVPAESLPGAVRMENGVPLRNAVSKPSFICPDFDGLPLAPYAVTLRRMADPEKEKRAAERQLFGVSMPRSQAISTRNASLPPFLKRSALVLPYYFNNGCVFNCAFCVQSREDWTPFCSMQPEAVVRDLKMLTEKYNTPYVRFFNNAFNLSPRFAREFCTIAKREDLHILFSDCGRFNGLTREDAVHLYEAGCRKLVFGLDSASPAVLKMIDKQLDLDQVKNGLLFCREAGIETELEIIVGMPGEGWQEFQESYDFVAALVGEGLVSHLNVNRYFVLPASRFGQYPERYGIALETLPEAYHRKAAQEKELFLAFLHPDGMEHLPMRVDPIRYYEPGRRTAEQIIEDNLAKYRQMRSLTPGT